MPNSLDLPLSPADRLPPPVTDEARLVRELGRTLQTRLDWAQVQALASPWVNAVREHPAPFWALESLMREYPISSAEGLALMRLAEALLRVPDTETAVAFTADQLSAANFGEQGLPDTEAPSLFNRLAGHAVAWSKKLLPAGPLFTRLGSQTVVAAAIRAVQLLGHQFVLGEHMAGALARAQRERTAHPHIPLSYSYDMLGEGARTDEDAQRYHASYARAIASIAGVSRVASIAGVSPSTRIGAGGQATSPEVGDGISIKLSALDPRYEVLQLDRVGQVLLPRLLSLVDAAAQANINLTIDAEESDRLELSLKVLEALCQHVAAQHPQWQGLGLAVQAYQTRSLATVQAVIALGRAHGRRLMVRLVKGAYWDGEVKRAQEMGLSGFPVWTHKHHTDVAYLACAAALLAAHDVIYAQFASHNAATIAAVLTLAAQHPQARFELQRLHGMGEAVYREVYAQARDGQTPLPTASVPALRIYAPVGEHRDLLAYLVRRLLENGANASFVHQLSDAHVSVPQLLGAPFHVALHPGVTPPAELYAQEIPAARQNSDGLDLAVVAQRLPVERAIRAQHISGIRTVPDLDAERARATMTRLAAAQPAWSDTPLAARCQALEAAADALQKRLPEFVAQLVVEARKTPSDAMAEVREAIDFCRYYATQARVRLAPQGLPGPTGERNTLRYRGRGVFVCISPWNFPLAIFVGQVAAALVAGNAVAAKPAEQTPGVAAAMVDVLHQAGVPTAALQLCPGPGETVGAALVAHPTCAGVCFTGSTAVARHIQMALATRPGPIVPLMAETGGLNALLVDSTALPEQVIDAVVQSAFRSAGQRCSALRLLCVHEAIAEPVLRLLAGAMQALRVGAAADLSTDVGPVIDAEAHGHLSAHVERLSHSARLIARSPMDAAYAASHIAPIAFELDAIADLREEVFGPVLHVVRWSGPAEAVMDQINALGYGLTLGIHTRMDSRAEALAARARVGNVYVNRNIIGAVVGSQPFGGEGLSGTGPKAGGPNYLMRFCTEQTVTVNTAAAGGNAELLAGMG